MTPLPQLIAVLAMLLPMGSGETCYTIAKVSPAVARTEQGRSLYDLIYCPGQAPSQSESYFECIDESALDEEDSTRVEDHGLVQLTLLDYQSHLAYHLSTAFLPAHSLSLTLTITPILRC